MTNKTKENSYSIFFSISFGIILIGMIIDFVSYPSLMKVPEYPFNLYIILAFVPASLLVYYVLDKHHKFTSKLYSVQAAITSVSAMTIVVLLMGFIKQEDDPNALLTKIGLTHVTQSWSYILTSLYLLLVLTFSIYKRIKFPITLKNFAFFLNHAGLWIVIVTASLGAGDLKRLYVYIKEGEIADVAYGENNKKFKIPFEITLHDFVMEEYPPQIGIFYQQTGEPVKLRNENNPKTITDKMSMKVDSWTLELEEFLSSSLKKDSIYVASNFFGSYPSAKIKIKKDKMKISRSRWLAVGNSWTQRQNVLLSNKYIVSMLPPTAKKYASQVSIKLPDNQKYKGLIEVNKPYKYKAWKIYQSGYDTELGKYSKLSILELVYDPWLPLVYIGIFMLIAGALYLIFFGKHKNIKQ